MRCSTLIWKMCRRHRRKEMKKELINSFTIAARMAIEMDALTLFLIVVVFVLSFLFLGCLLTRVNPLYCNPGVYVVTPSKTGSPLTGCDNSISQCLYTRNTLSDAIATCDLLKVCTSFSYSEITKEMTILNTNYPLVAAFTNVYSKNK